MLFRSQNLGQGNPSDGFDVLKYNMDNLIRVDSETLRCPMIILVKGINYMETISAWVLRMLFYTFDLSDRQVPLLDGHFDWYRNLHVLSV